MSNSYKTVSEIIEEWKKDYNFAILLKDAENYYAHTNPYALPPYETLEEHIDLVLIYFDKLCKIHQLDRIIYGLIYEYLQIVDLESPILQLFIKKLFVFTIVYHDHGKVNENFQASQEKMNNIYFKGKENLDNAIGTHHSTLSSYIYLNHLLDDAIVLFKHNKKEQKCAITIALLFSYAIYLHHSKYLYNDYWEKIIRESKKVEHFESYLKIFNKKLNNPQVSSILGNLEILKREKFTSPFEKSFPLYQLIRLNFSLLTASDYLATNQYMSGFPVEDFGVLSESRIDELYNEVKNNEWINKSMGKVNYNKKTYDELNTLSLDKKPIEKSNQNLNLLRQQMATEAIRNIRNHPNQSIFYLEAPTGGGKTNISMLLTLELLKNNKNLNKVYYVFPFTTLIDQTFESIKENLDLNDYEIVALHSKASFNNSSDAEDDQYGTQKKNYINRLFVNYPFCLLSHIRFFDILKTNVKETNYLLHRIANSIVVIDELQAYSPEHWDKVMYFIAQYARAYNIKFIIMSATLPKVDNLKIERVDHDNIVYLLPHAKSDYFQNINFAGRVAFDFSLLPNRIELDLLARKVLEESKNYADVDGGKEKPKGSVYTIIEFIFKKTATLFKQVIESLDQGFFDEIFVLSGTILHHRRRFIINYLKRKENRSKKILLITTQVVEAGVDIDMDLGFKDTSLIDSEEQLAGRINRNVNKENCKLFLFNHNAEGVIHKDDLRFEVSKTLSIEDKAYILKSKDFDFLYQKVIDLKNTRNLDSSFVGLTDYLNAVNMLQFKSVNEDFKLINQENFSCFIPMKIPINIPGENDNIKEAIFNDSDLNFLATYDVFPDLEDKISGEEVFDVYLGLIGSNQTFITKKIALKEIQAILSKFIFSTFATEKIRQELTIFMNIEKSEYGYFYMDRYQAFYDEKSGINESSFENIDLVQFI
ncbi:CRISPR-associated helicase Cas3' [Flavobacteriaceae bacterium Ap0902]|nr:CRISPR-associated helicase Cas3' [Flavobacteriaceae bacterium Ap0902]